MPSSTSHDPSANLVLMVEAHNPVTELFVVDSNFALVGRGLHRLEIRLQPGIYKLKARLGLRVWERHFALEESKKIEVPPIEFASAVPLTGTSRTHETHIDLAMTASQQVERKVGSGARIFVMSRQWAHQTSSIGIGESVNFRQVRLRRWRGDVIADFRDFGRLFAGPDSAVAGCIEVNEGNYLLEFETPEGTNLQTIFARNGWQTQAFILYDSTNIKSGISTDVSVLMTRGSFEPSDSFPLAIDAARLALAQERLVASDELMVYARGKFENPILGIISAHLLLIAQKRQHENEARAKKQSTAKEKPQPSASFKQELYDEIVRETRKLLGPDQPDVVALSLRCRDCWEQVRQIRVPPMFWQSWQMLIEASNDNPDLIPESVWRRVDSASNLRPYFSWQDLKGPSVRTYQAAVHDLSESLGMPQSTLPVREVAAASIPDTEKPSADQLKSWATRIPGVAASRGEATLVASADEVDTLKRQMTDQLNIPRSKLDRTFKT